MKKNQEKKTNRIKYFKKTMKDSKNKKECTFCYIKQLRIYKLKFFQKVKKRKKNKNKNKKKPGRIVSALWAELAFYFFFLFGQISPKKITKQRKNIWSWKCTLAYTIFFCKGQSSQLCFVLPKSKFCKGIVNIIFNLKIQKDIKKNKNKKKRVAQMFYYWKRSLFIYLYTQNEQQNLALLSL